MSRGVLLIGLLVLLSPATALAQPDDMDAAIGQSQSRAATRDLRSQAEASVPQTDDRHELAIFHHRRGMAHYRLGSYEHAVADLRLALENNQSNRLTPEDWGDRWRIQNDLGNAYGSRGDRFAEIDLRGRVGQEYQQSNLFNYHYAKLRLMRAHGGLGQRAEAAKAREEAEAMLPRLRNTKYWTTRGFNVQDRHDGAIAGFFREQGNYQEAERRYRTSLQYAEKYLEVMQDALGKDHQTIRIALGNVQSAKSNLADILSTQGKYGEAEGYARAGLEDALAQYGFTTTAVGYALVVVGWTRFQQGDLVGAEKYYRHALAAVDRSGVSRSSGALAARRAALANAHIVQGRWDEALKLFEERDEGLRSDAAQFKRSGRWRCGRQSRTLAAHGAELEAVHNFDFTPIRSARTVDPGHEWVRHASPLTRKFVVQADRFDA